jgi:hypothetical protein
MEAYKLASIDYENGALQTWSQVYENDPEHR